MNDWIINLLFNNIQTGYELVHTHINMNIYLYMYICVSISGSSLQSQISPDSFLYNPAVKAFSLSVPNMDQSPYFCI